MTHKTYRDSVTLYQILRDQWSRSLEKEQVISEVAAQGFVVDEALVKELFRLWDNEMEEQMETP